MESGYGTAYRPRRTRRKTRICAQAQKIKIMTGTKVSGSFHRVSITKVGKIAINSNLWREITLTPAGKACNIVNICPLRRQAVPWHKNHFSIWAESFNFKSLYL